MIEVINKDCVEVLDTLSKDYIDVVLTSPPYNNSRTSHTEYCMKTANCRYDSYDDNKDTQEYVDWTVDIFNKIDNVLKQNGCVLYNISYGNENPAVMWETLFGIMHCTNFMIAEDIVWKKPSAFPNNVSPNHMTRITEHVFVFCRKNEYDTFYMNKKVKSISKVGQNFYENVFNYIEAPNNDGQNELNNATYSTELCEKLLKLYCPSNGMVFDPFNGTGTTGVACKKLGLNYLGTEISAKQVEYSLHRINGTVQVGDKSLRKISLWG